MWGRGRDEKKERREEEKDEREAEGRKESVGKLSEDIYRRKKKYEKEIRKEAAMR